MPTIAWSPESGCLRADGIQGPLSSIVAGIATLSVISSWAMSFESFARIGPRPAAGTVCEHLLKINVLRRDVRIRVRPLREILTIS